MAKGDDKLIRQLSLVSYLLSLGRPASAQEISRTVEGYGGMSEETFTRRFHSDREELERAGIVVLVHQDHDGDGDLYSLPPENYFLPDLELTAEESRSLGFALNLLEGSFPYVRPLRLALAGLTQGGGPGAGQTAGGNIAIPVDREAAALPQQLARLEDAVARRKRVSFHYFSAHRGVSESRKVDPYGLFRIGGHWYVVGRDSERDAERMFRLSRIEGKVEFATKSPRDFSTPSDYDPGRYLNRPPWLYGEARARAVVAVDPAIAWWIERSQPHAARIGPEDGPATQGRILFEIPYAEGGPLVSWVLELGRRAEILSPEDLRDQALSGLEEIAALHRDPTRGDA